MMVRAIVRFIKDQGRVRVAIPHSRAISGPELSYLWRGGASEGMGIKEIGLGMYSEAEPFNGTTGLLWEGSRRSIQNYCLSAMEIR
ncbi:MAG: hypothetical protein CV090_15125 [Nitrospira sp. WS238]|nr:hypothetical protein [Nitrospira sp. WS238]